MKICFNICLQTLSVLEKSWKFVSEKGCEPCFKPIAQEQKHLRQDYMYKKIIIINNNNNNIIIIIITIMSEWEFLILPLHCTNGVAFSP